MKLIAGNAVTIFQITFEIFVIFMKVLAIVLVIRFLRSFFFVSFKENIIATESIVKPKMSIFCVGIKYDFPA